MKQTIVAVSDVSLGYGSPQILMLTTLLQQHYQGSKATVFEPNQPERPLQLTSHRELSIQRVTTQAHPHTRDGWADYLQQVAAAINRAQPDIVLICNPMLLPLLFKLTYRPRFTIYYCLESLSYYLETCYWCDRHVLTLHQQAAPLLDLMIYPEENRAISDLRLTGLTSVPLVIFYNVSDRTPAETVLPAARDARILYAGTIDASSTFPDYYLRPEMADLPVDLYGNIAGCDQERLLQSFNGLTGQVHYKGFIKATDLDRLRPHYAYSICLWAPTTDNQRYAAPNKFFEAIADGVPPVVAPHPQCKMLVNRYQCGIIMQDWSFAAFHAAIREAMQCMQTPRYAEMVANCQRAVSAELNAQTQFAKVKQLLPQAM